MSRYSPSVVPQRRYGFGDALADAFAQSAAAYPTQQRLAREDALNAAYRAATLQLAAERQRADAAAAARTFGLQQAEGASKGVVYDPGNTYGRSLGRVTQTPETALASAATGVPVFDATLTRTPGVRPLGGGYIYDPSLTPEGQKLATTQSNQQRLAPETLAYTAAKPAAAVSPVEAGLARARTAEAFAAAARDRALAAQGGYGLDPRLVAGALDDARLDITVQKQALKDRQEALPSGARLLQQGFSGPFTTPADSAAVRGLAPYQQALDESRAQYGQLRTIRNRMLGLPTSAPLPEATTTTPPTDPIAGARAAVAGLAAGEQQRRLRLAGYSDAEINQILGAQR